MSAPGEVLLGRLAVEKGLISQQELDLALKTQGERGGDMPIGKLLVELGLLSRAQVEGLLGQQKENLQAPSPYSQEKTVGEDLLGRRAVEAGLLTREQLAECLRLQGLSQRTPQPKRLGEVVVAKGLLTAEQVRDLLAGQGKRIYRCPQCSMQYNVHGSPKASALKCRHCGTPLAEAPAAKPSPSAGPAGAPPSIDPRTLKAEGSWYEDAEPSPPARPATAPVTKRPDVTAAPGKKSPPKRPVRQARVPNAVKVEEDVAYLPYERRVPVGGKRKVWIAVGAVGLLVLGTLLLVRVAGKGNGGGASAANATRTDEPQATAATGNAPRTVAQELDELSLFLEKHGDDPLACFRRLEEVGKKVQGTGHEEQIAAETRAWKEKVLAIGKAEFAKKMDRAREAEMNLRFGEALAALDDLPLDRDPLGTWNKQLDEERIRIPKTAQEEWSQISAKAMRFAREGKKEEALREAKRGETFGIAAIEKEARELVPRLTEIAANAPPPTPEEPGPAPATQPPVRPPTQPPTPPAGGGNPAASVAAANGTFEELIASLGGATTDAQDCPLCRDLSPRDRRTCAACGGAKQAPCPMCKGTGTSTCPGGVHEEGSSCLGESGDPDYVKKALSRCKLCDNHAQRACPACKGGKTVPCHGCGGRGVAEWSCPLSKASATIPASGDPCWLCKGKSPVPCPVCAGKGTAAGSPCPECSDTGRVACANCSGWCRVACGRCGGSGRVRVLTKAGGGGFSGFGSSGGDPDAGSCDLCGGKGCTPCDDCKRTGTSPCSDCSSKGTSGPPCWACKGKGKLDACPACGGGVVAWARTPGGGALLLCTLADFEPLIDRGLRGMLRSDLEWMVLVVDNAAGKDDVPWTADDKRLCVRAGGLTTFVARTELDKAAQLKSAVEQEGPLFGLWPGALRGTPVAAGRRAVFLLACRTLPKLEKEVTLHAGDGNLLAKMACAPIDGTVRRVLLRCWTRDAMAR